MMQMVNSGIIARKMRGEETDHRLEVNPSHRNQVGFPVNLLCLKSLRTKAGGICRVRRWTEDPFSLMATSASVNLYDSCIVESGRQMRSNRKRDLRERSNRDRVRRRKKKKGRETNGKRRGKHFVIIPERKLEGNLRAVRGKSALQRQTVAFRIRLYQTPWTLESLSCQCCAD